MGLKESEAANFQTAVRSVTFDSAKWLLIILTFPAYRVSENRIMLCRPVSTNTYFLYAIYSTRRNNPLNGTLHKLMHQLCGHLYQYNIDVNINGIKIQVTAAYV